MFREILKKTQPIVYKSLNNLLINNKISHAFLLVGKKGTGKKETAVFMAQSFLCENDVLACETCNICKRIKHNNYADFIYIDGSCETIKKEQIVNLQDRFSLTSLEKGGKKIYIINQIDKASVNALNSLLKFLEEPCEDVIAILICESLEKVLPTIVSRCQIINFRNPDSDTYMKQAIKDGVSLLDAYLISNIKPHYDISETLNDEYYQLALVMAKKFLTDFNDLYGVLFYLQTEIFTKDNIKNSQIFIYLMDILILFFIDLYKDITIDLNWYGNLLNNFNKFDYTNMVLFLIEARDKCSLNNFNVQLIAEQLFYKILREVEQ